MSKKYIFLTLIFILNLINIHGQEDNEMQIDGLRITVPYGSFLLPDDWIEITEYSKNRKYFYSHQAEPRGLDMTNISIETGTNPYQLEEHMTFRYAILRQLLMQAGMIEGTEVLGSGGFTNHDYPLYIFTLKHKDRYKDQEVITIQYYIIGDRKHILIHLTDFHHDTILNADEVARKMADSFVWTEY